MQGKAAMRSSESIAADILQQLGYKIVDMHRKVVINNIEISDVDIIAEKNGMKYAVEVKAGPADVSSIRQIYVNSKLLNMIPMIISRGLADEKAEELAKELNVYFISLSDQVITNLDEIYASVKEALVDFLSDFFKFVTKCDMMSENEVKLVYSIAVSEDIIEASKNFGMPLEDFTKLISNLHNKGFLPSGKYEYISLVSKLMLIFCNIKSKINAK
ncbi:putative endonuclease (RecB family) [Caldisphaera lagunensis DSM 15908]|uniref:Putative endonuclease (RecB family) n=1 Tax=Caldisphaera lagunensis (strain DSM 15908 / JCM 11604 / ANMR 0165 / IC-154) TaxID=1056495 RepID=L0A857_CALLD|nr:endonuclease (RecB family) [Caldisphaera lagunensis]AFZ70016.1 putative endonuclease (RecB family) [Caldisphaera lagunensis DSM 15908]